MSGHQIVLITGAGGGIGAAAARAFAAGGHAVGFRHLLGKTGVIVLLAGGRVFAGPRLDDWSEIAVIVEVGARWIELDEIAVATPIISPWMLTTGPPELPGLIGASIWMKSS